MRDLLVLSLVLSSPLLLGLVVWLTKSTKAVEWATRLSGWIAARRERAQASEGVISKYWGRPAFGFGAALVRATEGIPNPHLKAGVRLASIIYLGTISVAVLVAGLYIVVGVIAFAIFYLLIFRPMRRLVFASAGIATAPGPSASTALRALSASSHVRQNWLGREYVEHRNSDGNVVGTSTKQQGFFGGEYTEHRDADGRAAGTSQGREGFFGSYVEHRDAEGAVVGESHEREGFFGPYTEERDAEGRVVAESRKREGFFETYVEHEKR